MGKGRQPMKVLQSQFPQWATKAQPSGETGKCCKIHIEEFPTLSRLIEYRYRLHYVPQKDMLKF